MVRSCRGVEDFVHDVAYGIPVVRVPRKESSVNRSVCILEVETRRVLGENFERFAHGAIIFVGSAVSLTFGDEGLEG
jgi:hypothetical protein